jgi:hypothetical protein
MKNNETFINIVFMRATSKTSSSNSPVMNMGKCPIDITSIDVPGIK